jgi:undecaprenyl-diphosphatase
LKSCDIALFQAINGHHAAVLDWFFGAVTELGNGWVIGPVLAFLVVWRFRGSALWRILIVSTLAMFLSGFANDAAKASFNRSRPPLYFNGAISAGGGSYHVHVVGDTLNLHSFPSGHANTAFSAAALLSILFGGWFWLGYGAAALVAYSRVYVGAHFPFDTLAGAVLGMVVVYGVWLIVRRWSGLRWSVGRGLEPKDGS